MAETVSQKAESQLLSRQIAVLQTLNKEGISLPSALAFLLIAGETMQLANPGCRTSAISRTSLA